ncbi:MAG: hypothetical protein RIS64_1664 [Bacteroidota bacterium]|jgi:hypothetical protein
MLKIEIPVEKAPISDAAIRQMVATEYQSYRRKKEWKGRIAAFFIFCSLMVGGRYWYQSNFGVPEVPIAIKDTATDIKYSTAPSDAEAVLVTLLRLPQTKPVLKDLIKEIKASSNINQETINASNELSLDERLYLQALLRLKNKDVAGATNLLKQLSNDFTIKKEALEHIQAISK